MPPGCREAPGTVLTLPASALPPTPEREPAASSRALPLWPQVLVGPHPKMAKDDPKIPPLSQPPHSLEKQCLTCLPVGATSFSPGGWDGGEDLPDPNSLSHTLPAHLAVVLRQPFPQDTQELCSETSGCGCRENGLASVPSRRAFRSGFVRGWFPSYSCSTTPKS